MPYTSTYNIFAYKFRVCIIYDFSLDSIDDVTCGNIQDSSSRVGSIVAMNCAHPFLSKKLPWLPLSLQQEVRSRDILSHINHCNNPYCVRVTFSTKLFLYSQQAFLVLRAMCSYCVHVSLLDIWSRLSSLWFGLFTTGKTFYVAVLLLYLCITHTVHTIKI
jgi:hypothetical protein